MRWFGRGLSWAEEREADQPDTPLLAWDDVYAEDCSACNQKAMVEGEFDSESVTVVYSKRAGYWPVAPLSRVYGWVCWEDGAWSKRLTCGIEEPHLHVVCKRCGYSWAMAMRWPPVDEDPR